MDVEKFLKIECNPFDREIFSKIFKCELNLFYLISRFKQYDKDALVGALNKRKILFRDIEFSDDGLLFRRVKPRQETVEESFDKEMEFARNMYFVHEWHDELEERMRNDSVLQAEIEAITPKWKRKSNQY